jgi:DNA-directed RNA polymerase specialized sigma24 family protein
MSTEPQRIRHHDSRDQPHQQPSEAESGGPDASGPSTGEDTRRCERLPQLLARCKEGDQQAWRELHDAWDHALRLAICTRLRCERYARCRGRFGDSDLLQETWMIAWEKLPEVVEFVMPEQFLAWLTRISEFVILRAHRVHRLAQKRSVEREQPLPTLLPERSPPPDQVAEAMEAWDSLMGTLTQRQYQFVTMVRAGHTHEEIATALDVSVRTIARLSDRLRKAFLAEMTRC